MNTAQSTALAPARLRLIEHALLLIGRGEKAGGTVAAAATEELASWRQADPAHAEAAVIAARMWSATDGSQLKEAVPPPRSAQQAAVVRRRVATVLGIAGLVACLTGGASWVLGQPTYELSLSTNRGQLLAHSLPDGTQLDLGPLTAATVTYYRDRREVRLQQGEVRLQVQPQADRPLEVGTPSGRVRVLGTTFSVSERDGRMRVSVAEGKVAVWPRDASGDAPAVLTRGQSVQTTPSRSALERAVTVQPDDIGAWRQGWLVFDNVPLAEAVARWNDYLQTPISLGEEVSASGLRISGSFPLRQPEAFLSGLPAMLPVRVDRDGAQVVIALRNR